MGTHLRPAHPLATPAPARVLDVGGASGRYAAWLQQAGYQVQVVDPVPGHVSQATARGLPAQLGDARALPFPDHSADAVLLLGPLYHLPAAPDRAQALTEAVRVCAAGGVVIAAAMSRWAKPAERAALGQLTDPGIHRHLITVLRHGHDNAGDAFDRVSYNHDPAELHHELATAGLDAIEVLGVEGPLGSFARHNPDLGDLVMAAARLAERAAPHLSLHLLARGHLRPATRTPSNPG
jgi:ubiquinone/menaquinone biosynthesis C-methylase UbiE